MVSYGNKPVNATRATLIRHARSSLHNLVLVTDRMFDTIVTFKLQENASYYHSFSIFFMITAGTITLLIDFRDIQLADFVT